MHYRKTHQIPPASGCTDRSRRPARSFFSGGLLLGVLLSLTACGSDSEQKSDPVVVENAVAFIKRPLQFGDENGELMGDDRRDPAMFRPGARLFLKNSASPGAVSRDITSAAFADASFLNDAGQLRYDVRDLDVSYDGNRLVFAMRAPEIENADEEDQPTWNIWEYDVTQGALRRLISSDTIAEAGQDIAPAYLPDGRIVFSSTRQRASKSILLDEGKPQFSALEEERDVPAFVLHVMTGDGDDIDQITFNQSHDLDPSVRADGKVLFSRWDNAGQTRDNGVNLYQVNPDGTGLTYLYGRNSHDSAGDAITVQYFNPVETDTGTVLAQLRGFESNDLSLLPTAIDIDRYVDAGTTLEGIEGQGQTPLVAGFEVAGEQGLNGRYGMTSPLFDGTRRYLASWSPCRLTRLNDGTITNCTEARLASDEYDAADPVYGLWLLDADSDTQLPIERPVEGQQIDEAVLMTARALPTYIPDATLYGESQTLASEGLGVIDIRSVYDEDGVDTAPGGIRAAADPVKTLPQNRPAWFVRIEKAVSIPDDEVRDFDNSAFGRSSAQSMREILGYVPVEPDGSVRVAVPANVAFAISVLDQSGQRITDRHQNWLQVRPGETVTCHGCHDAGSKVPHGRPGAGPAAVYSGATTSGLPFPNSEPALTANMGETMAETFARINGVRKLTPDAVFEDQWTNPAVTAKAQPFSYAYADLMTAQPIIAACAAEWSAFCRTVINYEQHIHPMWSLDRPLYDVDGVTEIDNFTCTGCHTEKDAADVLQVPAAQLDLTDGPSNNDPDQFKAYRELLFNDNEQEVEGGILIDRLVETGEFERDEDGELVLDDMDNPIPILTTVNVPSSMRTAGARASGRFMNLFRTGGAHEGFLTDIELKLIAEWLDIGAQYYNNPFDAPED